jgi:hypothetical protein
MICELYRYDTFAPFFDGDIEMLRRVNVSLLSFTRKLMLAETKELKREKKVSRGIPLGKDQKNAKIMEEMMLPENVDGTLIEPMNPGHFVTDRHYYPGKDDRIRLFGKDMPEEHSVGIRSDQEKLFNKINTDRIKKLSSIKLKKLRLKIKNKQLRKKGIWVPPPKKKFKLPLKKPVITASGMIDRLSTRRFKEHLKGVYPQRSLFLVRTGKVSASNIAENLNISDEEKQELVKSYGIVAPKERELMLSVDDGTSNYKVDPMAKKIRELWRRRRRRRRRSRRRHHHRRRRRRHHHRRPPRIPLIKTPKPPQDRSPVDHYRGRDDEDVNTKDGLESVSLRVRRSRDERMKTTIAENSSEEIEAEEKRKAKLKKRMDKLVKEGFKPPPKIDPKHFKIKDMLPSTKKTKPFKDFYSKKNPAAPLRPKLKKPKQRYPEVLNVENLNQIFEKVESKVDTREFTYAFEKEGLDPLHNVELLNFRYNITRLIEMRYKLPEKMAATTVQQYVSIDRDFLKSFNKDIEKDVDVYEDVNEIMSDVNRLRQFKRKIMRGDNDPFLLAKINKEMSRLKKVAKENAARSKAYKKEMKRRRNRKGHSDLNHNKYPFYHHHFDLYYNDTFHGIEEMFSHIFGS